jgi:hypothetical protein
MKVSRFRKSWQSDKLMMLKRINLGKKHHPICLLIKQNLKWSKIQNASQKLDKDPKSKLVSLILSQLHPNP